MQHFRIEQVTFNNGETFSAGRNTIFVGPNNAGKSRILKEILALGCNDAINPVVLRDATIAGPKDCDELVASYPSVFSHGDKSFHKTAISPDLLKPGSQAYQGSAFQDEQGRKAYVTDRLQNSQQIGDFAKTAFTYLPTESRLGLLNESDLSGNPEVCNNLLQQLYKLGSGKEKEVSGLIESHFDTEVRLDFTNAKSIRLKVADDFGDIPVDPRDAFEPMKSKELLSEQGDGIRSFSSIVVALTTVDRSILLIDEPELFLHPPQAYQIGKFIGKQSSPGKQIFVSTHSSDFLRGYLSETADVDIIRITRSGGSNSFHHVDSALVSEIISSPLLSSAKVLEGLFYNFAIIVEADSDAKFFRSAIHRLNEFADLHTVAADNKQTVSKIGAVYNKMGVRFSGVVDFDMLRDVADLTRAMEDLGVGIQGSDRVLELQNVIAKEVEDSPAEERLEEFRELVSQISDVVEGAGGDNIESDLNKLSRLSSRAAKVVKPWTRVKQYGVRGLSNEAKQAFDEIDSILTCSGFFIYPLGELESSLVDFGIPYMTDKREWIIRALKAINSLEVNEDKEFWRFIRRIAG